MAFVVKVSYKGDVRRSRFPSIADVTFKDVSCMVTESFGLATYTAKYKDEEGDWCTATPQTFSDALEVSAATNSLRLDIVAEPDPETCSCASDVSSSCSWEEVNFPEELDDSVTETDSQVMPIRSQEQEVTVPEDSAASHSRLDLAEKESHDSSQKMPASPQEQTVDVSEKSAASHVCIDPDGTGQVAKSCNNSQVMPASPQEQAAAVPGDSAAITSCSDVDETGQIAESHAKPGCDDGVVDATADVAAQQETAKPSEERAAPPPLEGHAAPPLSEDHAAPPPSEERVASPPSGYDSAPPRAVTHSWYASEEKIQIVLAAFDANGDGHLNFEESNELQKFAAGDQMPLEVYKTICAELRVTESKGPGKRELEFLYERYDTLERDFEAALRKIEGGTEMQTGFASRAIPEIWGLPLVGVCPLTLGAAAVVNHMVRSRQ